MKNIGILLYYCKIPLLYKLKNDKLYVYKKYIKNLSNNAA